MSARMQNLISKVEEYYDEAQAMQNGKSYSRIVTSLGRKINGDKYYFFGSRKMGVATSESDLDLFVEFGEFLIRTLEVVVSFLFRRQLILELIATSKNRLSHQLIGLETSER